MLRNDFFTTLQSEQQLLIVLLVPNEQKKTYFEKEFTATNVVFEIINEPSHSALDTLYSFLKKNLVLTHTLNLKRNNALTVDKNYGKYFTELLFSRLFANRIGRALARSFRSPFIKSRAYSELLAKYKPTLILSAHIFGEAEATLLREAKRRGIKTIGLINSWDKITSRGMAWVLPDKLLVHNELVRDEAVKYLDIKAKDVTIIGIPHYDIFFRGRPTRKELFFQSIGLDPDKKIILFCPMGATYCKLDATYLNILVEFQLKQQISDDFQILVRFPPNDDVDLEGLEHPERIIIQRPGIRFTKERGIDWDMNAKDIQNLFDTLYYTSILICPPSSISIDAAVFDKPIINIKFAKYDTIQPNSNMYFESEHYGKLVKTGGIRVVRDELDLLNSINAYYNDPRLEAKERARIVRQQCWQTDGQSGMRAARFIIDYLSIKTTERNDA